MKLTPVTLGNRIETLDIMRGFALLGIFIANMLHFHSPYLYFDPFTWFSTPGDAEAFKWIDIFVEGSFYPIFAMLFGYGLNMQYEKSIANGLPFAPIAARRLGILAFIGVLHALFLWYGDVLFTYAIMGFVIIALVRIPAKWLVPLAAVIYIVPTSLLYVITKLLPGMDGYADIHQIELSISAYAYGTYSELFVFRLFEWLVFGFSSTFMGFFIVLPIIMIGVALSKWQIVERSNELKGRIVALTVGALALGIWLKALPYIGEPTADVVMIQDTFGGVILAAGYVGVMLYLFSIPLFKTVFKPIAKVGRMSLTTYITQSVVATTIFYSYGFGLYGKIDLVTGTWIAVGVFSIQVIIAELWLSKFKMGPLEWLWRKGTYGKVL
ncbi:DUF418 domain-containing protein [Sporosarcina sp. G11-34]|uniref:DUF418 domain-containing protein n=1 Tax=Sporosarcina sp. G11-34 TaxID=2849605 RepID=UPI0022A9591B|nr:DUF418 domain-containing protein [Sporosarcina sp. G11-34]MCZ2259013.1 DUF418 domain-containing protein [Sporosarcina sp. G11-34]